MAQPTFLTTETTGMALTKDYTNGMTIVNALHAASGEYGIRVQNTYTYATSGAHKVISGEVTYTPSTEGYSTPIGVQGKVSLGANFTGGTGYMWGVQGVLDLGTSRTLDNSSSIFAALRGVIAGSGTVDTDCEAVCCAYLDNLNSANLNGFSAGHSSFLKMHNAGGNMDNVFEVFTGNKVSNLFRFDQCGNMVVQQSAASGTPATIAVDWEGTQYYINMYQ